MSSFVYQNAQFAKVKSKTIHNWGNTIAPWNVDAMGNILSYNRTKYTNIQSGGINAFTWPS